MSDVPATARVHPRDFPLRVTCGGYEGKQQRVHMARKGEDGYFTACGFFGVGLGAGSWMKDAAEAYGRTTPCKLCARGGRAGE